MSNNPAPTLQEAYHSACVQIAEAYAAIRLCRKNLKDALHRRDMIVAEGAQVEALRKANENANVAK